MWLNAATNLICFESNNTITENISAISPIPAQVNSCDCVSIHFAKCRFTETQAPFSCNSHFFMVISNWTTRCESISNQKLYSAENCVSNIRKKLQFPYRQQQQDKIITIRRTTFSGCLILAKQHYLLSLEDLVKMFYNIQFLLVDILHESCF